MTTEDRLKELGIELPSPQSPAANYVPAVRTGNLLYLAGVGPAKRADGTIPNGKVGAELTKEEGYEAARLVCLNILSRLRAELGDLESRGAGGQAAGDGKRDGRLHRASCRHQRMLRPAGRGIRRAGEARALGGRDAEPAVRHTGGDRGDSRGSRLGARGTRSSFDNP